MYFINNIIMRITRTGKCIHIFLIVYTTFMVYLLFLMIISKKKPVML